MREEEEGEKEKEEEEEEEKEEEKEEKEEKEKRRRRKRIRRRGNYMCTSYDKCCLIDLQVVQGVHVLHQFRSSHPPRGDPACVNTTFNHCPNR